MRGGLEKTSIRIGGNRTWSFIKYGLFELVQNCLAVNFGCLNITICFLKDVDEIVASTENNRFILGRGSIRIACTSFLRQDGRWLDEHTNRGEQNKKPHVDEEIEVFKNVKLKISSAFYSQFDRYLNQKKANFIQNEETILFQLPINFKYFFSE